jgi:hypothetical protein
VAYGDCITAPSGSETITVTFDRRGPACVDTVYTLAG